MRNCTSTGRITEQGITAFFESGYFQRRKILPFPFNFSDVNGISMNKVLQTYLKASELKYHTLSCCSNVELHSPASCKLYLHMSFYDIIVSAVKNLL